MTRWSTVPLIKTETEEAEGVGGRNKVGRVDRAVTDSGFEILHWR